MKSFENLAANMPASAKPERAPSVRKKPTLRVIEGGKGKQPKAKETIAPPPEWLVKETEFSDKIAHAATIEGAAQNVPHAKELWDLAEQALKTGKTDLTQHPELHKELMDQTVNIKNPEQKTAATGFVLLLSKYMEAKKQLETVRSDDEVYAKALLTYWESRADAINTASLLNIKLEDPVEHNSYLDSWDVSDLSDEQLDKRFEDDKKIIKNWEEVLNHLGKGDTGIDEPKRKHKGKYDDQEVFSTQKRYLAMASEVVKARRRRDTAAEKLALGKLEEMNKNLGISTWMMDQIQKW